MNIKQVFVLSTLILLTGCGISGGPSQKEMEDLLSQARVDTAANQYQDAEKKLAKCLHHADKNSYIRLAALNRLADVEFARKNDSKATSYVREAGAIGETLARTAADKAENNDTRILSEARKALLRWADDYLEIGHFDSARTLYTKAQILEQRSDETVNPADSADYRLKKLDERVRGETQAIEHDDLLADKTDPRYHARMQRTKERKQLMQKMHNLILEIARKPNKEAADKMLVVLEQILTKFGVREGEYRAALSNTVEHAFSCGNREKALSLLKEDIAKFDHIKQADIDRADPTTIEDAHFLITDLSQLACFMIRTGDAKAAGDLSARGLELAERVKFHSSAVYADLFKAASWSREYLQKFDEAIPLRRRQIAILKQIKLTDNYAPFANARLDLGRDLTVVGKAEEGIKHIDYAIAWFRAKSPDQPVMAYAYTAKADALRHLGDLSGARESMLHALPLWEKYGNLEQKYGAYKGLGKILRLLNKGEESRRMALKALDHCRRLPAGQQRTEIPDCYLELALTDTDAGEDKRAYEHLSKAYEAQVKARGENDFNAAGMLNFLAMLQGRMGNNAESEKLRLRAVEACRKSKETPRTPVASTLLQLANFYHTTGHPDKAEKPYREVLAMGVSADEPHAIHYERMARVQLAQILTPKNKNEATKLKDQAIAKLPSANGIAANDASYYSVLGDVCLNLSDFENGLKCYDEALKIARSCKPPLTDLQVAVLTHKRDIYKVTKRNDLMQKAEAELSGLTKPQ